MGTLLTISISADALVAFKMGFPGDWRAEIRPDGNGDYLFTLPHGVISLLKLIRQPDESYSDVILRLAAN